MADKAIGSLTLATTFGVSDRIVLEQDNTAKAMTGQTLIALLATALDGHGGIDSLSKTSSTGTNPVIDTWTFVMADATTMSFQVTNGIKGDTGAQTYVWIKYASHEPTQDSDMTTTPDNWIGIYVGTASTAPSHYTSYAWYAYKGDKGDTGDPAELTDAEVVYQEGTSGTVAPTGTWTTTVPSVAQGNYLWTRTTLEFNTGSPVVSYAVARIGVDGTGTGTVQTVNGIPDVNGNVEITASDIDTIESGVTIQDKLDALSANGSVTLAKLAQEVKKAYTTYRASLTIPYASWTGSSSPYSQTITIPDAVITSDTKVDIQPTATVINQLMSDGVTGMFFYNNSGTLTVYAVGASPTADLSVQVTYYETQEG